MSEPLDAVPWVRYRGKWVKLVDLTSEQIAYLREVMKNVITVDMDVNEVARRAWLQGRDAAYEELMYGGHSRMPNPYGEDDGP